MNQGPNKRDPRRDPSGRDFADFLAGSSRMDTENNLPLPDDHEANSDSRISAREELEDLTPGLPVAGQKDSEKSTSRSDELMTEVDSSATESAQPHESGTAHSLSKDEKKAAKDQAEATVDEGLRPELRDRAEVIGSSVRWFAGWCLRFIIMGVAAYVASIVFAKLWSGILPVLLSLIVCTVLWPVVRTLRKFKIPNGLAVALTIVGFFALIGGIFAAIAPSAVDQSRRLATQANDGIGRVREWLQGPPVNLQESQFEDAVNQATEWLQQKSGDIASQAAAGASATLSALVTLFIMLVLTFFFLKDGEKFLPMLRRVTGRRVGWHLTEVLTRCWNTLGGFIRTQAIVSAIDAFFIGLGLVILNVPLAGALAILTFFGGFIPMIGAFVAGALSVLIALVAINVQTALIVLAIVVAVQQLEGNILQPLLQSRAMDIHPVIVLLSVTLGGTLFGIIGAFLAVPVAAVLAVIFRYMGDLTDLATGEKTAQEIKFVTTAGSLTGRQSEEAAMRRRELLRPMLRMGASNKAEKQQTTTKEATADTEGATGKTNSPTAVQQLGQMFSRFRRGSK
ncbi:AI-2E family transporter [uncultured Corynebacterium sp.]|uniref:AI-2E family transporter n=1 Tax=uncultured Corynebacterium sp. TaxID=159447 RepID=UPI0025EAAE91|nr:AI-2E family transporter [uncultured Corynebacterium sp.]